MTYPIFNEATWIEGLAAALEQVAVGARPSYSPLPPAIPGRRPIGERCEAFHSGYRALAARAKHDPTAAVQFRESSLSVTAEPVEAMAILREHPLVKSRLKGSGTNEGFGFWFLNRTVGLHLKPLVLSLAKLSVKEGGQEAARRLHRFVTALANRAVPAHEITVVSKTAARSWCCTHNPGSRTVGAWTCGSSFPSLRLSLSFLSYRGMMLAMRVTIIPIAVTNMAMAV